MCHVKISIIYRGNTSRIYRFFIAVRTFRLCKNKDEVDNYEGIVIICENYKNVIKYRCGVLYVADKNSKTLSASEHLSHFSRTFYQPTLLLSRIPIKCAILTTSVFGLSWNKYKIIRIIREDKAERWQSLIFLSFNDPERKALSSLCTLCRKWFEKAYRLTKQLRAQGATSSHTLRYFSREDAINMTELLFYRARSILYAWHLRGYSTDLEITKIGNIFSSRKS